MIDTPVTVVVPVSITDEHRARAWAFVRARWQAEHPTWPLVTGECADAWRKAVAVVNGVRQAEDGIVIITDADVWTPGMEAAVNVARRGAAWVKPHARFVRLTPAATDRVLAGDDLVTIAARPAAWLEKPYPQVPCGGVVIMTRKLALDIPGDPRFTGWGGQDIAWSLALRTLAGPIGRADLTAVHLWHPPQERIARNTGSAENEALRRRYADARRNPDRMRALVREAKEALP